MNDAQSASLPTAQDTPPDAGPADEQIVAFEVPAIPRPISKVQLGSPLDAGDLQAGAGEVIDEKSRGDVPRSAAGKRRHGLLYRAVDGVLWVVNRPFDRLGADARHLIAVLAVATIVVSVAAGILLPRLCGPRDIYSRIHHASLTAAAHAQAPAAALEAPPPSAKRGH